MIEIPGISWDQLKRMRSFYDESESPFLRYIHEANGVKEASIRRAIERLRLHWGVIDFFTPLAEGRLRVVYCTEIPHGEWGIVVYSPEDDEPVILSGYFCSYYGGI